MRDAIVQLCCCNWSHRSIGSSQELTLRATIAIVGSCFSMCIEFPWESTWDVWFHMKMLQRSRKALLTTQTTGRYYTPQKKCAKVTAVPPLHGRRHPKTWLLHGFWPSRSKPVDERPVIWQGLFNCIVIVRSIFHVYINCIYIYI